MQGSPQNLSPEMCPSDILEKVGSMSKTRGDLSDFCRVLRGNSFCQAGPETCHKKCVQRTCWKKWGAGPRPGRTYLILVGSWSGAHFLGQAPKPVTRNISNEHLRKIGGSSNTWGDLFDFCRVLKRKSFCRAGPETCHKKCAQ